MVLAVFAFQGALAWDAVPNPLPVTARFRQDVCLPPAKIEYARSIAVVWDAGDGSCCSGGLQFFGTTHDNQKLVEPLAFYLRSTPDPNRCSGRRMTDAEETEVIALILRRENEERDAAQQARERDARDRERDVRDRVREAHERQDHARVIMLEMLRASGLRQLCAAYGNLLRGEPINLVDQVPNEEQAAAVRKAALTRKIQVDIARVKASKFRIGDSACQVYAAFGLPDDVNRTVGAGRIDEQLVYRSERIYVYLRNGMVTSWQD